MIKITGFKRKQNSPRDIGACSLWKVLCFHSSHLSCHCVFLSPPYACFNALFQVPSRLGFETDVNLDDPMETDVKREDADLGLDIPNRGAASG